MKKNIKILISVFLALLAMFMVACSSGGGDTNESLEQSLQKINAAVTKTTAAKYLKATVSTKEYSADKEVYDDGDDYVSRVLYDAIANVPDKEIKLLQKYLYPNYPQEEIALNYIKDNRNYFVDYEEYREDSFVTFWQGSDDFIGIKNVIMPMQTFSVDKVKDLEVNKGSYNFTYPGSELTIDLEGDGDILVEVSLNSGGYLQNLKITILPGELYSADLYIVYTVSYDVSSSPFAIDFPDDLHTYTEEGYRKIEIGS